jgi:1,4-alpha-glucan branching enzyme
MVIKKGKSQVTFVFTPENNCRRVQVVGSFNDWEPAYGKMIRQKDGSYRKRVQLTAGQHRYKFLVDDQWFDDPQAEQVIPNPFGSQDALVTID